MDTEEEIEALLNRHCSKLDSELQKEAERTVFDPRWPDGVEMRELYTIPCDDDGPAKKASLSVMIADDGDVHLSMSKFIDSFERCDPHDNTLDPMPSVRIRTLYGGGKNLRTRQALLWLAQAIRLDNQDNPENLEVLGGKKA